MRKPASREMISASVELCEDISLFLTHLFIGTNVWPKIAGFHRSRFCVFKFTGKFRVLKQSQSALLCSISHMTMLFKFTRMVNPRSQNEPSVCNKLGPIGDCSCKFVRNDLSTNACQMQTFQDKFRANFGQFSNRSQFFFFELVVVKAWSCDLVQLLGCFIHQFAMSLMVLFLPNQFVYRPHARTRTVFLQRYKHFLRTLTNCQSHPKGDRTDYFRKEQLRLSFWSMITRKSGHSDCFFFF